MNDAYYQQKFATGEYGGDVYDVASLLRKITVPENYRYLELGVGTGRVFYDFFYAPKAKPQRICAADLDNNLRLKDPAIEFQKIELGKKPLPYADGSFDLVMCNHVLEHIFETEAALRELKRVTAPGGLCVISVPNIANWWSRFAFLFFGELPVGIETGTESADDGHTWILRRRFKGCIPSGHIRGFTPRALRDICERCGFTFAGWWNQNMEWHNKILQPKMGIILQNR